MTGLVARISIKLLSGENIQMSPFLRQKCHQSKRISRCFSHFKKIANIYLKISFSYLAHFGSVLEALLFSLMLAQSFFR